MILLLGLICILCGEPGLCLEEHEGFTFDGDIRRFAVATNTVYIATQEKLYQLSHDLVLVRSLTLRGILRDGTDMGGAQFNRVSDSAQWNSTFSINVLLPFVGNESLISCGGTDGGCGYCEVLDLKDISKSLHSEQIQVGPVERSDASVAVLVNVKKDPTKSETFILTAVQSEKEKLEKCGSDLQTVNLYNTDNDEKKGGIFSLSDLYGTPSIRVKDVDVEFVDGFQISSTIYLLSNVRSGSGNNRVRLIWLEGKSSKTQTLKSFRGATLRVSDVGGEHSRLVASSVIPGGPPVLWSGVFSVDGTGTNTELLVFDISPDLTGNTDSDPDFCSRACSAWSKPTTMTLKPKSVLFRQSYMTSVLAVKQKTWMVFFIGTANGQLIKLAVDKNYHTTCPRVLYRASDNRPVFPKIHLDQVDHKHVYVALRNQMKHVPVSNCSTYRNVHECLSAQDPYCVWCNSKNSCTFEDDCKDSERLSTPDDFQQKVVSYKLVKNNTGQLSLIIQTHLTVKQTDQLNFACQFPGVTCRIGPSSQFPQCTCILTNSTLPAKGLHYTVRFTLGTLTLTEQLKLNNINGSPRPVLSQECVESGCSWSPDSCLWANQSQGNDSICQTVRSGVNFSRPDISSITPSVVSFYGRNHAVLSGHNLSEVTRVRIQSDMTCTPKESPVWNNTGVNLTFHIPSTDSKGVVKVCVVLPDGSCHGNSKVIYLSSPSCIKTEPSSTWFSGKRTITVFGSHLDFVEGVFHSHNPREVIFPRNISSQNLTYETAAAENTRSAFISSVFLKVANETLVCSTSFTYYPDPEFITFTSTKTGNEVLISLQKKEDELEMTAAELSVWGVQDGKQYPCIMKDKETNKKTEFFSCQIENTTDIEFQYLMIKYGDKTIMLGPPSLLHRVLMIVRLLLILCVTVVLLLICRWQKKLSAQMKLQS
ncbi:plexin-C1-like [Anabas testudineus]|uniref:plexin-C1-like n=1 Tax=Anabas testudineus TaxID=64144 RepID=UPI000E453A66|nr:plexin-C1-like [Anabas testudineus]